MKPVLHIVPLFIAVYGCFNVVFGESDEELGLTYIPASDSKTYVLISNKPLTQARANGFCDQNFAGQLAEVRTELDLQYVDGNLTKALEEQPGILSPSTTTEIWIYGKTNVEGHAHVNLSAIPLTDDDYVGGENCLVLSNWRSPTRTFSYEFNVFSKADCSALERKFLCETTPQNVIARIKNQVSFWYYGEEYKPVFNQLTSARGANDICQRTYGGSLASITTEFLLSGFTEKLKDSLKGEAFEGHHTFWTCGKVETVDGGFINVNPPPTFQQGSNCVTIASRDAGEESDKVYDLRARDCHAGAHDFLCIMNKPDRCPEGVTSHQRAVSFDEGGVRYIIVLYVRMDQNMSQTVCRDQHGASLANITTTAKMDMINQKLHSSLMVAQHSDQTDEFWVGGKTNIPAHNDIDVDTADLSTGTNCVIISNWARDTFMLYSKQCDDVGRRVICELPVKDLLVHDHDDTSEYLFVLNNPLNYEDAQRFCHVQYGGDLLLQSETTNLQGAANLLLRGHLSDDVRMFWTKQNLIRTDYGTWEIRKQTDCMGNDFGRELIRTSEGCLQRCHGLHGCVGVVFGWSSTRGYECYPKTRCNTFQPLQKYDTYTVASGEECKVLQITKDLGTMSLDTTTVPCQARLGFVCALKSGPTFMYYYILDTCPEENWVSNVAYPLSRSDCERLGGAWSNANCVLHLCGSNTRKVPGWMFVSPGECREQPIQYTSALSKFDCRRLKGNAIESEAVVVNCTLQLCNNTKEDHLSYVISTAASCPIDNQIATLKVPLHQKVCRVLTSTNITVSEQYTLRIVDSNLVNAWYDCPMTLCQVETDCKTTLLGETYQGTLSHSASGRECRRWDTVNVAVNDQDFPENSTRDAANFCRNPTSWAEGPYCYVDSPDEFELCNLPFCKGHGEQVEMIQLMEKQYILVPGHHLDPWGYCARTYGAQGALLDFIFDLSLVDHELLFAQFFLWLADLGHSGKAHGQSKVLLPARVPSTHAVGKLTDSDIKGGILDWRGEDGWCVYLHLSEDIEATSLFAEDCESYEISNFLCERDQARYVNYQVEGGIPQMGVHDLEECVILCKDECRAAGYNSLEQSCWHYYSPDDCKPGRSVWSFTYVQKAPCECHRRLLDEIGVLLNMSSKLLLNSELLGADIPSIPLLNFNTMEGIIHGAWIPNLTDAEPWIQVLLPGLYKVYGITTKGLMAGNGIDDSWVTSYNLTYSKDCDTYTSYQKTLGGNKSPDDEVTITLDNAFYARCVKLYPKTFKNRVALRFDLLGCRVHEENLALGKRALQTTTYRDYTANLAVDGFSHANEHWGSCSITMPVHSAYFAVDLRLIYEVEKVTLQNRRHCCIGHLGDFSIQVGYSIIPNGRMDYTQFELCAQITGDLERGQLLKVNCEPVATGRFVVIKSDLTESVNMAICEIEIYSSRAPVKDVAMGKPCEQSSRFNPTNWGPELAVDGQLDQLNAGLADGGSCTHTMQTTNAWWMVDLLDRYLIKAVGITNRNDCCPDRLRNFVITVGEEKHDETSFTICAKSSGLFQLGETKIFHCESKLEGRFVKISKAEYGYLTLCEVQVYARKADIFTYDGNGGRRTCAFPFIYNNATYEDCTSDGKDKPWCAVTSNFDQDGLWGYCMDVRLRDGRHAAEGRVDLMVDGNWESVCDDGWNDKTANIVCKQLGYRGGVAAYPPMFPPGKAVVLVNDLTCYGNESALIDCSYKLRRDSFCTAREAAAVICSANDGLKYYGQPAYARSQREQRPNATILIQDPIQVPGFIESWHLYASAEHKHVFLQVWRRMYDFKHIRYMLVSESRVQPNRTGYFKIVAPHHSSRVEPGDVIGLSFTQENPIPYDYTFHCDKHANVLYRQRATAMVGSIHTFFEKDEDQLSCRLYSLYAKVQVENILHLHEFTYANHQYRVYLQRFTASAADLVCKTHMGDKATLVNLTSAAEDSVVQSALSKMDVNGSFWIRNTLRTEDKVVAKANWAPCQPESGKQCIVMSNDNDKGEFLWYTKQCNEKHFIVCQFEVVINEAGNRTVGPTVIPPSLVTSKPFKSSNKNIVIPIVIPIVLILLVIGVIVAVILVSRHMRKRRNNSEYRVQTVQYRGSTAEDEAILQVETASTAGNESLFGDSNQQNISNPLYTENDQGKDSLDLIQD